MKAHIINGGVLNGLTYKKDYVYSVSEHRYNEMAKLGMVSPLKGNTVAPEEVKAPKAKEVHNLSEDAAQVVTLPKPKVSKPSLLETKEEKHENPIEE